MPQRALIYATPPAVARNVAPRVPEDFPTIQAGIDYFKGKNVQASALDIAPGTYNESLIISDIDSTIGSLGGVASFSLGSPGAGVFGTHGLELRARGYTDNRAPGVIVQGISNFSRDVGLYGIRATLNQLPSNLFYGFASLNGGILSCYDCQAIGTGYNVNGSYGWGFLACNNGIIRARRAVATNLDHGLISNQNGLIYADNASSSSNRGYQFYANANSQLISISATANGQNGLFCGSSSYVNMNYSTFTGTTKVGSTIGVQVESGSLAEVAYASLSTFAYGFYAAGAKGIFLSSVATNCTYAFLATYFSFINASGSAATASGNAFLAQFNSYLFAGGTMSRLTGNTTNYSPATNNATGNTNSAITFS